MGAWFARLKEAVSGTKVIDRRPVVETLQRLQRNRTRISLEAPDQSVIATTIIEQVAGEELVISQPSIGGLTYPLAFGETLHITFVDSNRYHAGETRCLGRAKIPAGGESRTAQPLYAYRLTVPDTFIISERRSESRVRVGFDLAPEAQLYSPILGGPVIGSLTNVSMTGACVRTLLGGRILSPGEELYLKTTLPEPVGIIDEVVEVSRVTHEARSGHDLIGLTFRRRIQNLLSILRPDSASESAPQRRSA